MATEKLDVITVRATQKPAEDGGAKVVLWEKDEAHPGGEVFVVADGKSYKVAETAAVKRLIGEGVLVNWSSRPAKSEEPKATPEPKPGTPTP